MTWRKITHFLIVETQHLHTHASIVEQLVETIAKLYTDYDHYLKQRLATTEKELDKLEARKQELATSK